jgi:hypothetical protein
VFVVAKINRIGFNFATDFYDNNLDSPELFSYKQKVMKKLFRAFEAALEQRAAARPRY